ncbi:MAG: OsmC family protein [Candidatus Fermentibacteraceae bacterium]|nr:OsmC family protein [Candidatus Fermentibacteraceae bacterium]MBN2609489.1 OsmC family protein [Candidatus Fermentibacteraceae bacterium]
MEMEIVFSGGKRVDAKYGDFTVRTDQSPLGGGEGSAPEPFDLFFASMGTCAGIYVLSFCRHHDLPFQGIRLLQRAERSPESGMFERLFIEIFVPEDFPEKYHGALVRSAEQCTVKRHIAKGLPEFEVAVVTY